jgi:hypothetical protein
VLRYYGQCVEVLRKVSIETPEGRSDGIGSRMIHTEADKERKEENFCGPGGEILIWRGKREG